VGVASEEGQYVSSIHLPSDQSHRIYACTQTSEVEIPFITKVGS